MKPGSTAIAAFVVFGGRLKCTCSRQHLRAERDRIRKRLQGAG